jgi:hypothetical protein
MFTELRRYFIPVSIPPEARRPSVAEELFARYWARDDSGHKRAPGGARARAR